MTSGKRATMTEIFGERGRGMAAWMVLVRRVMWLTPLSG
jgi:hypothetical protein